MILALFPELLSHGGVQRAGRHIAAVLAHHAASKGLPYRCLALNDPAGTRYAKVEALEFAFDGFKRSKSRFVVAALRSLRGRPTLVLAGHPNLAPVACALKWLSARAQVVVMAYGVEVWTPPDAIRRVALRSADQVLAVSSDTADRVVAVQGVPRQRVRVLPLGLDPEFAEAVLAGPQEDSGTFSEEAVILTVARLTRSERYKGTDVLITAVSRLRHSLPGVTLQIVGDGDDRPRLECLAGALHVADRVRFLGNVSAARLADAYRQCMLFALPSEKEGFGLVFLEAMAFGKPVVGGAHGGTLDIVEHGSTGYLVAYGDVETLTQTLERLLKDDALRKEMGQRARERVRSTYLFEHFRARLTEQLESIV